MLERFRARLTYANVMSTIAVFGVLAGGVAWALDRNAVKSRHIAPGAVKLSDTNDRLRLKCPGGTRYHQGACIETEDRAEVGTRAAAAQDCHDEDRRLPSVEELEGFRREPGIELADNELTSHLWVDGGTGYSLRVSDGGASAAFAPNSEGGPYRCVVEAKR